MRDLPPHILEAPSDVSDPACVAVEVGRFVLADERVDDEYRLMASGQEPIDGCFPTTQLDNGPTRADIMRGQHIADLERLGIQILPFYGRRLQQWYVRF